MAPATRRPTASAQGGRRLPARAGKRLSALPEPDQEPDLLGQYLRQIGATPLLDAEDEVRLAQRIEAGLRAVEELERAGSGDRDLTRERRRELEAAVRDGQAAKDHMIRANLRLVVSMAKRHAHRGLPLLDVIQEGNLGLIRAVEKFDHTKGFKFSTYATWWIRQAIERGVATHARTVRLPVHVVEQLQKLGKVERRLQLRLDREPTVEEVAGESGIAEDRVAWLRRVGRQVVSLDTPVDDTGDTVVGDLIPDTDVLQAPEVAEFQALAEELRGAIDTLAPREALILSLRYGLHDGRPRKLQEVAEHVGLTRERVRQLEKQSLAHLREREQGERLLAWAG
ncbi:sigma-70 family RNA polymerase sigma factor [Streptomyces griseomycini]|uniref:RNA polymerase primary sigma factor/RNA polymerase nonessential primary-like sigma factor n=1 Tax=Streptomyces griseomycini TaxID=66895 RepID=A0A7W7PUE6_9ACTN|nr:sigma-70 family RNA polymerase sigma factor [Streptomyces griseomycini]MBB4901494.1 RNA polymerase primary sigma factor/RNA polymerase nonessential primary-like sigma factor [Streptomyces griseomycini]GGQ15092.1 RNA polymerase principal sigma factor HrdC [Streptomyces griseomycini]GGR25159.1 RNA polymerase principal sigma factor HrdC [Streptomyces griseomycini]